MQTQQFHPITRITDIPGAIRPNHYDDKCSINSESALFVKATLDSNAANYAHPVTVEELAGCVVQIENFKHRFKSEPALVDDRLNTLKNISSPWNFLLINYETIKELFLKGEEENEKKVQRLLLEARLNGDFVYKIQGKIQFPDLFPNCQFPEKMFKDKFFGIMDRYAGFPEAEVKNEVKTSEEPAKNLEPASLAKDTRIALQTHLKNITNNNSPDNALNELNTLLKTISPNSLNTTLENNKTMQEYLVDLYCEHLGDQTVADNLLKALRHMVEAGANLNVKQNPTGRGLLHSLLAKHLEDSAKAIEIDSMNKMIQFLYDQGLDFNARDNAGNTPLHVAATTKQYPATFQQLILLGAGLNILNSSKNVMNAVNEQETPLDILHKSGSNKDRTLKLIDFLKEMGGMRRMELRVKKENAQLRRSEREQFADRLVSFQRPTVYWVPPMLDPATGTYRVPSNMRPPALMNHDAPPARVDFANGVRSIVPFIDDCHMFDFTRRQAGKTILDLFREEDILVDVFSCPILRTVLQSQLPHAVIKPAIKEAEQVRTQKMDQLRQQLAAVEAAENARAAALEEKARADKKAKSTQLDTLTPDDVLLELLTLCKGMRLPGKQERFNQLVSKLIDHHGTKAAARDKLLESPNCKSKNAGAIFDKYYAEYKAPNLTPSQQVTDEVAPPPVATFRVR